MLWDGKTGINSTVTSFAILEWSVGLGEYNLGVQEVMCRRPDELGICTDAFTDLAHCRRLWAAKSMYYSVQCLVSLLCIHYSTITAPLVLFHAKSKSLI